MAKTFKSFVYDLKAIFKPELINGMCYGIFRLSPEYKTSGAPFGFDWIRTGDAKEYVECDEPYSRHIGRYYKKNGDLVMDIHPAEEPTFITDTNLFKQLCTNYPISGINIYPSPNGNRTPYYVPVLSIYPYTGKSRDIAKLIVELRIRKSPAKIELIFNAEYFEINGITDIPTKKGKHKVEISIKCIQEFSEDQYIRVVSYNSKGKRKNAGMLRVCKNKKEVRRELSVLLVNTKMLTSNKTDAIPLVGDAQQAKEGITQYLRHALMNPQFDIVDLDLGYQNVFRSCLKRQQSKYFFKPQQVQITGKNGEATSKLIYEIMTDQLKRIRNIENYDALVYCMGAPLLNNRDRPVAGVNNNKLVLLMKDYSAITACHEVLHTLRLGHSFSNIDVDHALSEFTYEKYKTDNIMDYTSGSTTRRSNLWEWQWKKIRTQGYPEI